MFLERDLQIKPGEIFKLRDDINNTKIYTHERVTRKCDSSKRTQTLDQIIKHDYMEWDLRGNTN